MKDRNIFQKKLKTENIFKNEKLKSFENLEMELMMKVMFLRISQKEAKILTFIQFGCILNILK